MANLACLTRLGLQLRMLVDAKQANVYILVDSWISVYHSVGSMGFSVGLKFLR